MTPSEPFPSFFDPNKSWVITDVWDRAKPFTDKVILEEENGQDHRWSQQRGYYRPEEIHPVYRISENGIDIGWVVFTWQRLDESPFLFGYETKQDSPILGDAANPTISAFTVANSDRTDYRFEVTALTTPVTNPSYAITIQAISTLPSRAPDPQPSLWGPDWSATVPLLTPQSPASGIVTFRAWVRHPNNKVSFLDTTATGTFPPVLSGFYPLIHLPIWG